MLTPGFGGPNGPAFPSHARLSHAKGPHPPTQWLHSCLLLFPGSGCTAVRPGAAALAGRILAQTTWITSAWKSAEGVALQQDGRSARLGAGMNPSQRKGQNQIKINQTVSNETISSTYVMAKSFHCRHLGQLDRTAFETSQC